MLQWTVRSDGSFDLEYGSVRLLGAYPAIDGVPVRAMSVCVRRSPDSTVIIYKIGAGLLELELGACGESATLAGRLTGMDVAPRSVHVLDGAVLPSGSRCFRQGRGMAGGSGLVELRRGEVVESWGITGLLAEGGDALVIYAEDHRRFEQRCVLQESRSAPGKFCLAAGFQTEAVPLTERGLVLPLLKWQVTRELAGGLRSAAESIAHAMNARPVRPASWHWCSWYYLYQNLDMTILRAYLKGFASVDPDLTMDYVQIDAGYAPSLGDWLLPSSRFPGSLKPAFELIAQAGYRPGVWIGPFMVGNRSRLAQEHPDWLLKDLDGHYVSHWRHYGEHRVWGYRDEETYMLDTSHPDAMEYLRQVFRTLRGWGAVMFKTDFMYWGLHDTTQVRRHTPGRTGVEYFRDVLQMIRQEIGDEALWLGCIAPFMPFIGYADAMRIGGDVGAAWHSGFGPQSMLRETVGCQHFNNVFWQNDPDVIMLRDFHVELSEDEITSLALWQSILGGVVATSDPLHEISESRRSLWHFVRPSREVGTARLPLFTRSSRTLVAVREVSGGDFCVLVFNTGDVPVTEHLRLSDLGMEGPRFAFRREVAYVRRLGVVDELRADLRPHASALFVLSSHDSMPSGPMLGTIAPARSGIAHDELVAKENHAQGESQPSFPSVL